MDEKLDKIINDLNVVNAKLDLLLKAVDILVASKEVKELQNNLTQTL